MSERRRLRREQNQRRTLSKYLALGGGIIIAGAGGAYCILPESLPTQTQGYKERIEELDRAVGRNNQAFHRRLDSIKRLGSGLFAASMSELYGLNYDPNILAGQVTLSPDARRAKTALLNDLGCSNFSLPDTPAWSGPGLSNTHLNAAGLFDSALSITPTKQTAQVTVHELGHHTPPDKLAPDEVKEFQATIKHPDVQIIGAKGFGLIAQNPKLNKPGRSCLARPAGDEFNTLEEAFVEHDANLIFRRIGLYVDIQPRYVTAVTRFRNSILNRLSEEDKRKIGQMHKNSQLIKFLAFYKQNFNADGDMPKIFLDLNRMLI